MIRRTITTMTVAAITTIVIATAAPALAAPPTIDLGPIIDLPAIEEPCTIETDFGPLPCPVFDWDLGGSVDIGGVVTDTPVETVLPEDLIDDSIFPDIDLAPLFPLPTDVDRSSTDEGTDADADIERLTPLSPEDLDALRRAATPSIPIPEPTLAPAEEVEIDALPDATVDTGTDAGSPSSGSDLSTVVTEPSPPTTSPVVESTTTTVGSTPFEPSSTESVEAATEFTAVDLTADTGSGTGFSVALAALIGAITAIALAGTGFGAYKFGQRGD